MISAAQKSHTTTNQIHRFSHEYCDISTHCNYYQPGCMIHSFVTHIEEETSLVMFQTLPSFWMLQFDLESGH